MIAFVWQPLNQKQALLGSIYVCKELNMVNAELITNPVRTRASNGKLRGDVIGILILMNDELLT